MGKQATYSKGLSLEAGGVPIRTSKDGEQIPVLTVQILDRTVSAGAGIGSGERLAENVVSLLNGHSPAHRLEPADNNRIFFQRAATGLILNVKEDGPGLSRPAVGIMAAGSDETLSAAALAQMDNLLMKALCDTVRPAAAPYHGSGGGPRPSTPQP